MDTESKLVLLGLYSAFFGVLFTGVLAWGHDITLIGVIVAKIYTLITGPLWLFAAFKWTPTDTDK